MNESGVAGVLVGRGALRNPWIFAQAAALAAGQPPVEVCLADRGRFLLEYIDILLAEGPGNRPAAGHARWVVNKLRALCAWYTRGLEGGAHLREAVNHAPTIAALRETISRFFFEPGLTTRRSTDAGGSD
jgi:tRNA-dihydrouridine synthase